MPQVWPGGDASRWLELSLEPAGYYTKYTHRMLHHLTGSEMLHVTPWKIRNWDDEISLRQIQGIIWALLKPFMSVLSRMGSKWKMGSCPDRPNSHHVNARFLFSFISTKSIGLPDPRPFMPFDVFWHLYTNEYCPKVPQKCLGVVWDHPWPTRDCFRHILIKNCITMCVIEIPILIHIKLLSVNMTNPQILARWCLFHDLWTRLPGFF